MKSDIDKMTAKKACLVVGLGHTGCRVLESLAHLKGYGDIEQVAVDTDAADLSALEPLKVRTLLLGQEAVGGHGTGGDQELAMHIMIDAEDRLKKLMEGRGILVLVAALGGGTGGAAEAVLKIADEMMLPTILLAVMPFYFESQERRSRAEEMLSQMDSHCQVVVRVPNDKLLLQFANNPASDAFGRTADYLAKAAACLVTPFASNNLFNVSPSFFNTISALDGNPRCLLAHVTAADSNGVKGLQEALKHQYAFEDRRILEGVDRAIVLLRVNASCREEEMDFAITQARALLPDAETEAAACMDDVMEEYISMTVLLHVSAPAAPEEEGMLNIELIDGKKAELPAPVLSVRKKGRGKVDSSRQLQIPFIEDELGIFAGDPENNWNGGNIDIPTFRRQKITIDKGT